MVLLSYVPVVHAGIIQWVKQSGMLPLYVLDESFIAEFPQLKHDLRAVKPDQATKMLRSLGCLSEVLNRDWLKQLQKEEVTFILPHDEVMIQFACKYLADCRLEYRRVFIRWDKINTTSEEDPSVDRMVLRDQLSREIMDRCRVEAQLSSDWWRQVGAMAIFDGQVPLMGVNRLKPTDYSADIDGDIRGCFGFGERVEICGPIHAEAMVVAKAAAKGIALAGADFYTTTFPCPMCARLLVQAGVKRVIYETGYSVCDANEILNGAGVEIVKLLP